MGVLLLLGKRQSWQVVKLHGGHFVSYPRAGGRQKAGGGVRLVSSALKPKGKPSPGDVWWTIPSMSCAHPGGNNL